jgi:antitoxin CcdA
MATVSARIPDELKRRISEEEIVLSEVVREALEKELERRERENLREEVDELGDLVDVEDEEVVESIREDRKR